MTRPLRPALLVLLTLTLAFAGCGQNGASNDTGKSAADTVPDGIPSYEEPKDAKEVTLLLNEDRWGEVAPCGCKKRPAGGLPRLATVIEKYKASDGAIVVEVGDSLYPPLVHQRETSERMDARAEFIMDALPAMGLDVYVPGGADMEIGLDKLLTWRDEKKVPMVAANINDASTQQPLFDAYKIFEHDGVKVALIGVAGSTSYAAARANADYQPKLREQARRRAAKGGGSRLLARLRDDWSAAANKGDSEAQKHLVQKMMGEADFGGREGNKPAKDEELPAEDAYTGRRFRIVDPVVSVNRVIDEIGGKADILIAVANVDDAEME
ncbi:hypothetical protein KDL45_14420, partial [bacterium]|nr:hypothetical protein [bacterium]